jgi:hypothetical protein
MSQWGNIDRANNSVIWGTASVNKSVTIAERDLLYGNTTAGAYISGVTIGQFGIDTSETAATSGVAHAGWILRTVGSGGRAGRIQYETLVAGGSITGDGTDDGSFPDAKITILTQPSAASANSTAKESVTFNVGTSVAPTTATLGYAWYFTSQAGNTASYVPAAANTSFSGATTATLTANSTLLASNTFVRVDVFSSGAANVTSSAAKLTVTT